MSSIPSLPAAATRSPLSSDGRWVVAWLAVGAFALGMASYVTAGLLPQLASAFEVAVGLAAQLVTAFTLAYGLGSPVVVALLPATRQRAGLLLALLIFTLANAASALSESYRMLLVWRAVAGVGAGVYLALAISAATTVVPPARQGRAIAHLMGGMASGTVLGVPLGLWLAERWGWAAALWLVTLLGALACLGLVRALPQLPVRAARPLAHRLVLLRDQRVLRILLVSLLAAVASLGMYTFLAPLALQAGLPVTPVLWAWGLGGVAGSFLVGPLAARWSPGRLAAGLLAALALALLLLPLALSLWAWSVVVPVALWGAVGWALQVPQNQALLEARPAAGEGELAVALNESALYLGSAAGALLGGGLLLLAVPLSVVAWGAAGLAVLACVVHGVRLGRR